MRLQRQSDDHSNSGKVNVEKIKGSIAEGNVCVLRQSDDERRLSYAEGLL